MILEQREEIVTKLFNEEPMRACRIKAALDELLDIGFHDETVWYLYKAFLPAWIEHTGSKN